MDPTAGGNSSYPVGTLDEVRPLRMDLTNVATCSQQTTNNMGCPYFRTCRHRQIRDGAQPPGHDRPLIAPENIAVFRQLPPAQGGEAAIIETTCFGYYVDGFHGRWEQMEKTGEVIKILGVAGDGKSYKFKRTIRAHAKRDPNCDDCSQGKCIKTKTEYVSRPIERFKRPADRFPGMKLGAEIREQVMAEREREHEEGPWQGLVEAAESGGGDEGSDKRGAKSR